LFNPAFAYFSNKAFNPKYEVPHDILRDIQVLMGKFACIHSDEDARRKNIAPLLETVIGQVFIDAKGRHSDCRPNRVVVSSQNDIPIHLIIDEEKNEIGDGGSDPAVQALFSFLRIMSREVK